MIDQILKRIKNAKVFLAYNANIDNIVDVEQLKHLINEKPKTFLPNKIKSIKDIVSSTLYCMETGEGHQIEMPKKMSLELKQKIKNKKRVMGGQAGIMSNYLSKLNANCTVYTPFHSNFKKKLFNKKVKIISDRKKEKNNWIFHFDKNQKLFNTKAKSTNRFIAAERNKDYIFNYSKNINKYDYAIFAGFQNIISHANKQLNRAAKIIKNSNIPVHFEFVYDPIIEDKILNKIAKPCYSMGADHVEIREIAKILNHKPVNYKNKDKMTKLLKKINKDLNLQRLYLHTPKYFLTVGKNLNENTKRAMEFAEIAAAAHALGPVKDKSDLKKGKNIEKNDFKTEIKSEYIIIPNRMVENPRRVVGLGDIISASLFVGETILNS